jgi:hypothetical protein
MRSCERQSHRKPRIDDCMYYTEKHPLRQNIKISDAWRVDLTRVEV